MRVSRVFASIFGWCVLMAGCSRTSDVELAKARQEAEAAKSEVAAVKAELAKARADLAVAAKAVGKDKERSATPPGGNWADWKYPNPLKRANKEDYFSATLGTEPNERGVIGGGYVCATADDFEKVLDFYFGKIGAKREEWQGGSFAKGGWKADSSKAEATTLTFRSRDCSTQPDQTARPVKVHCIFLQTDAYTVSLVVTRAEGEKHTYIVLNHW